MSNCITHLIQILQSERSVLLHFVQNPVRQDTLGELDVLVLGHVVTGHDHHGKHRLGCLELCSQHSMLLFQRVQPLPVLLTLFRTKVPLGRLRFSTSRQRSHHGRQNSGSLEFVLKVLLTLSVTFLCRISVDSR